MVFNVEVIELNTNCGEKDIASNYTTMAMNQGSIKLFKEVSSSTVVTESTAIIPLEDLHIFEFNNSDASCHIVDVMMVIMDPSDPTAQPKPWNREDVLKFDSKTQSFFFNFG